MVDGDEEGGESFAGAGGGGDEGGVAAQDCGPAFVLRLGGGAELGEEPLRHDGVRPGECGCGGVIRVRGWVRPPCAIVARGFVVCSLASLVWRRDALDPTHDDGAVMNGAPGSLRERFELLW